MSEYPMDPDTFDDLDQTEDDTQHDQEYDTLWFDQDDYQDFLDFLPSVDELQHMHARKI